MHQISEKLYSWATNIDDNTIGQAARTSRLPIVEGHVALMPDAHYGLGATVGSVIPTKNAVIPAAVGVDIGCGMAAALTSLTTSDLPDDLEPYLTRLATIIPAGVGQAHDDALDRAHHWFALNQPHTVLDQRETDRTLRQFGTLGSGNHFVEVSTDELNRVWLVLHSGSRGIGNRLAQQHIKTARGLEKQLEQRLEDPDLAYFVEGTPEFAAYIRDMRWAQDYARENRHVMLDRLIRSFYRFVGHGDTLKVINCHHNFTQQETHNGQQLWITRKGAIEAKPGQYGIIPGSMGTATYIVRGLGNPVSWNSSAHGAGRVMSRTKARKQLTVDSFEESMKGKTWMRDRAEKLIDEAPAAYKNIHDVMSDQLDLVEPVQVLHQILNYKGL